MNVLVDTSVWVAHFKHRDDRLVALLEAGRVLCHPHVVLEIACGTPPRRAEVIHLLRELEAAPVAMAGELLDWIERHGLYGRGCGLVDVHLLAAARLAGQTLLWTLDRRLEALACDMGLAYQPALSA